MRRERKTMDEGGTDADRSIDQISLAFFPYMRVYLSCLFAFLLYRPMNAQLPIKLVRSISFESF